MHQSMCSHDPLHPSNIQAIKSLYGLKQAPRAWYNHFASYIFTVAFVRNTCDNSLFIYKCGYYIAYLLLYVDDIILTVFSTSLQQSIV